MLILALDSATEGCSVALWQDGTVLASRDQITGRGQAEILVPMVQAVRAEAGVSFADVDLFAVTVGPGSFTGVRIGLATARGLGLAAARPVAGVTTLEAVAWIARTKSQGARSAAVVLDSYRADVYVQPFLLGATPPMPLGPVQTLQPSAMTAFLDQLPASVMIVGNGISRLTGFLPTTALIVSGMLPQAAAVAAVAAAREGGSRMAPEPLYLRPADVTVSRAGGNACS